MKPTITKAILIEDLVDNYSFSVRYLMEKGIRCIMCGEPIWGTLEEAARDKGFTGQQIDNFVSEMVDLANTIAGEEENDKLVLGIN
jgi:methionine synthase II (cobalamin-independent)